MPIALHRRDVLITMPGAGLALLGLAAEARGETIGSGEQGAGGVVKVGAGGAGGAWPGFPRTDPVLARAVVGAAHRSEERVRELTGAHPALVNAAWDWGFGDWETALGAAAHTGRRSIAELLISRGARVDIFAAAMLGWTDVVEKLTAASPGIQRGIGPHGLTLLHHARAGGEGATGVAKHLETLGDADRGVEVKALDESAAQKYTGAFSYGPGVTEWFQVRSGKQGLEFVYGEEVTLRVHMAQGEDAVFFPSGVPTVRFRFSVRDGVADQVVISDHDWEVKGTRVPR